VPPALDNVRRSSLRTRRYNLSEKGEDLEIKEYQSAYGSEGIINVRSVTRRIVLSILAAFYRRAGRESSLSRNRVQFLYLHHLFPEEEESFRGLLRELARDHSFISYSEAVEKIWRGGLDKPYVSFSFDDGLKNTLRAAQILEEFGTSGCFFICPSIVGETNDHKLKEYCSRFAMPPTELLTWDDIEALVKRGHEIGSHTMTHPVLARASEQQIWDEVMGSYQLLTEKLGRVRHFAWPEGRFFHFNPKAADIVFSAGFESCASAERGCHVLPLAAGPKHGLCLRRDYVSAKWPLNHTLYFLARNSKLASARSNLWPDGWLEAMTGETS
jgi:peptidoglycan/xylan/chitin deacetylase (PgdA/CDA1 family)